MAAPGTPAAVVWLQANDALRQRLRQSKGRHPEPGAAIIDRQSVKTTAKGGRARLRRRQKRWGASVISRWIRRVCCWAAVVHPADVPDCDGARPVLAELAGKLPRRWVAAPTLGWLGRQRRLSKDYAELPESSPTWLQIAMRRLMLRRLAQKPAF